MGQRLVVGSAEMSRSNEGMETSSLAPTAVDVSDGGRSASVHLQVQRRIRPQR